MKKLIVFILFLIPLFCLLLLNSNQSLNTFDFSSLEKVCLVTKQVVTGENVLKTLSYNYVYLEKEDFKNNLNKIEREGLILYFNNQNLEELKKSLNLLILKEEKILDKTVIYAYTPKYKDFVLLDNKKVNAEIVLDENKMTVGFPMILSGY